MEQVGVENNETSKEMEEVVEINESDFFMILDQLRISAANGLTKTFIKRPRFARDYNEAEFEYLRELTDYIQKNSDLTVSFIKGYGKRPKDTESIFVQWEVADENKQFSVVSDLKDLSERYHDTYKKIVEDNDIKKQVIEEVAATYKKALSKKFTGLIYSFKKTELPYEKIGFKIKKIKRGFFISSGTDDLQFIERHEKQIVFDILRSEYGHLLTVFSPLNEEGKTDSDMILITKNTDFEKLSKLFNDVIISPDFRKKRSKVKTQQTELELV